MSNDEDKVINMNNTNDEIKKIIYHFLNNLPESVPSLYEQSVDKTIKVHSDKDIPELIKNYIFLCNKYYRDTYYYSSFDEGFSDPFQSKSEIVELITNHCIKHKQCVCGNENTSYCSGMHYVIRMYLEDYINFQIKDLCKWYYKNYILIK
jgi:hypothetical protein